VTVECGWTVFYRHTKARWILKYKDLAEWRQATAPAEIQTERDARTWAAGWLASREANGSPPVQRREGGPTARDLHERWVALRADMREDGKPRFKPATLADYRSHLRTDILLELGDKPIQRLDLQELRAWVKKLRGKHSAYRVHNIYSTARSMIGDAMAEGWVLLPANPLEHPSVVRELPARKAKRGPVPVFVELEHLQRVVACEDVPMQRRVRWLVEGCTGAGEGELLGRVWSDIDLGPKPTLRVHTSLATRGAEGWASMGTTKNEHRVRTIPLHRAAAAALVWWRALGWSIYVGRPPRPTDPVFPSAAGKFSRPASARLLRGDLVTAGCPDRQGGNPIDAKALRASFATWLDAAGVHEEQRGRLMGHAQKTVTAKHYTAAQTETDREAVNRIGLEWVEPRLVSALVPALVSPTPKQSIPSSHLRDLNPRPTVYESAAAWCRKPTDATDTPSNPHQKSTSTYGKPDAYDARHQGALGVDTKDELDDPQQLKVALGELVATWAPFDAFLLDSEAAL
jgi:integrase